MTILLLSFFVFFILILKLWNYTADDAFITFRYSKNLADGYGAVYNPEQPTEGYTTFLWMAIMAVPHLLNIDAVLFSKIAGILCMLTVLVIIYRLFILSADFLEDYVKHFFASLLILMICCLTPTAVHTVSGMETSFYTMLLVLFSYLIYGYCINPNAKKSLFIAVTALFAGLTRPEANMFVFLGVFLSLLQVSRKDRITLIKNIIIFYFIPGAIYFLLRYFYYGLMFPLSFYVKVSEKSHLVGGFEYLWALSLYIGIYFLMFIGIGCFRFYRKLFPIILPALAVIIFFLFADPIMGFEWRFIFPVLPLLLMLGVLGISSIITYNWVTKFKFKKSLLLFCALFLCLFFSIYFIRNINKVINIKTSYANGLQNAHIKLGKTLKSYSSIDYKNIIAISDAGAVPYYSMWKTIDTYGLNDNHIAFRKDHDPDYVLSKKPDLIVLLSMDKDNFYPLLEWETFLYNKAVEKGYSKINTLEFAKDYHLWIMAYSDNPVVPVIKKIK